jgi:AcrR family transcriptional regulator
VRTLAVVFDSIVKFMGRSPTLQDDGALDPDLDDLVLGRTAAKLGPRAHRTIARIIGATRDVFLLRGYAGTTVDEIARTAGVSRASFYTYFPSKREVLLAIGAETASESLDVIERLPALGSTRSGLTAWVSEYFEFLDVHGSFSLAWAQAAREDEHLRIPGMRRHLGICRRMGRELAASAGKSAEQPVMLGLVAFSLLERTWDYNTVYAECIPRGDAIEQVAGTLWGMARQSLPKQSVG